MEGEMSTEEMKASFETVVESFLSDYEFEAYCFPQGYSGGGLGHWMEFVGSV